MGYQFHRQVPMLDYIVDFYCHELNLAIEVDGPSHSSDAAKQYDQYRELRLAEYNVRFLRFENERVRGNIEDVLEEICRWITKNNFPPLPPHVRRRKSPPGDLGV